MIVLLHWLHAGVIIFGVLVVLAMLRPARTRRQDGRVADLRAAAEAGTLVRRAEARALAQLAVPQRTRWAADHLVVPAAARTPLVAAAVSSLTGSAIHAAVGPEHFRAGLRLGVFFVVLASVQCAQAALLLRRPSRTVLRAVVTVSGGTALLWLVTRTTGLPFGLAASESPGLLDGFATVAELVTAACAISVLRLDRFGRTVLPTPRGGRRAGPEAV